MLNFHCVDKKIMKWKTIKSFLKKFMVKQDRKSKKSMRRKVVKVWMRDGRYRIYEYNDNTAELVYWIEEEKIVIDRNKTIELLTLYLGWIDAVSCKRDAKC